MAASSLQAYDAATPLLLPLLPPLVVMLLLLLLLLLLLPSPTTPPRPPAQAHLNIFPWEAFTPGERPAAEGGGGGGGCSRTQACVGPQHSPTYTSNNGAAKTSIRAPTVLELWTYTEMLTYWTNTESLTPFIRRFRASNAKLPSTLRFEGYVSL